MDKKAVGEIRKILMKNDCRIDKITGVFVDEQGQVITELKDTWRALAEEEVEKYCEIFRKTLTGKLGKNLYNMEFPLNEEADGGNQNILFQILDDQFENRAMLKGFFQKIMDTARMPGRYLILLAHGAYDIPAKTSDGQDLDDASEYVYFFMVGCICPVVEVKEGLCFDEETLTFVNKRSDLGVQMPEAGFLFPAFNDRMPDIHSLLWYAKKEDERHTELIDALIGENCDRPLTEKAQQEVFSAVVEQTLGRDCNFENVMSLTQSLDETIKQEKDDPEPYELGKTEVRRLLSESGASPDTINRNFEEVFDEQVGEGKTFTAENLGGRSTVQIKSPSIKITAKSDVASIITSKVIDGREYILIPVQDDIELNGIRILPKLSGSRMKDPAEEA